MAEILDAISGSHKKINVDQLSALCSKTPRLGIF